MTLDQLQRLALFLSLWLFALGAIFGSFMNVVVYRLPRRMSLSNPGSRCPRCKHAIRWYHNLPIFGWLILRGKCRDCGQPIAARYPLIELATGGLFLGLAWVELFTGGRNLPERSGDQGLLIDSLIAVFAYHACLICVLLCITLIHNDRQPMPSRLTIFALAVGLVFPLFWPDLHPTPFAKLPQLDPNCWQAGLMDGLCGAAAGCGLAWLYNRWIASGRGYIDAAWICVGAYLGWQGALAVAIMATPSIICATLAGIEVRRLRQWPQTFFVLLAVCVWLIAWRIVWAQLFAA